MVIAQRFDESANVCSGRHGVWQQTPRLKRLAHAGFGRCELVEMPSQLRETSAHDLPHQWAGRFFAISHLKNSVDLGQGKAKALGLANESQTSDIGPGKTSVAVQLVATWLQQAIARVKAHRVGRHASRTRKLAHLHR